VGKQDRIQQFDGVPAGDIVKYLILLLLSCLLLVGAASAVPVTENTDLGWDMLIDNNYATGVLTHNNTFLATSNISYGVMNVTFEGGRYLNKTGISMTTGELYIGQIAPAREFLMRINISMLRPAAITQRSYILGKIFTIEIQKQASNNAIFLWYYDSTGAQQSNSFYTGNVPYIDLTLRYYPNGSMVLYNTSSTSSIPGKNASVQQFRVRNATYPDITLPTVIITQNLFGDVYGNLTLNNFEYSVPKKQITTYGNPKQFPVGFDVRINSVSGLEWLKEHNWTGTLWLGNTTWNGFNASQRAELTDLVENNGWEPGVHFKYSLSGLSWGEMKTQVADQLAELGTIWGRSVQSWCSLGNSETYLQQEYIWVTYQSLHRNNGFSSALTGITELSSPSTESTTTNMPFWYPASQYCTFVPNYMHAVNTPLTESGSIDFETDFKTVMTRYEACGARTVSFTPWYYESNNTAANISDVYLDTYGSHFTMDTTGWNASTRIIDPFGERVWYSATPGMMVITEIDNGATETNLTIRNNATDPVIRQANASIVPSSGKILVNVKNWTTTGTAYKQWNESATDPAAMTIHQIGDFPANINITVKKNGAMYVNRTTNSTGWMNFTYTDGYSDVMFEAEADTVLLAQFTPAGTTDAYLPSSTLFTDTSTGGSPTTWDWQFNNVVGNSTWLSFNATQNATFFANEAGNYSIRLNASTTTTYNISTQETFVNVTSAPVPVSSFTVNTTEGYSPLAIAFIDTSTNAPDAWTWNFTEIVNSTPITFSTSQHPEYTFGGGNYSITLDASNSYGSNLSTQVTWINVSAAPVPVASFTANQTEGYSDLPVLFTDTSTNTPTSWEWNFTAISNSTPITFSTSQNPTYTFGIGNYSVVLNATNAYGSSISSPAWINVSAPIPVASFSANATSGNAPLAVGFTDASTNTPSSWNWSFGDGDYSISQNPSHSYASTGNYTVNLTATNGYGSDTLSRTDYISVTSGNSFTQQDIWMDEEYTLTLNFVDSSTGLPVPVVMVVDASNISTSTNTTTGVYTGTFGYETVVLYLYSDGYAAKAVSYVIDGDRSETVSLTKSTTAIGAASQQSYPVYVAVHFIEGLGTPVQNVSVTAVPYSTSTSSYAYLAALLGIPLDQAPMQNQSMSQTSGSDGKVAFYVLPTTQYNFSYSKAGCTFTPPYTFTSFANQQDIYIAVTSGTDTSVFQSGQDVNDAISFSVQTVTINETAFFLNMTYTDTSATTTSGTVSVVVQNNTPYQSDTTIVSWPVSGSSVTNSTLVLHSSITQVSGTAYANITSSTFGVVNRDVQFSVRGQAVKFMGFGGEIALLFSLFIMMMTIMLGTAQTARQVTMAGLAFEIWVFYAIGWFDSLIARGVPETAIVLAASIVTVAAAFSLFEIRKKKEKY
jgi:PKD repeat protein